MRPRKKLKTPVQHWDDIDKILVLKLDKIAQANELSFMSEYFEIFTMNVRTTLQRYEQ